MGKKKISNKTILFILHGFGLVFALGFGMFAHDAARVMSFFPGHILFPANLSLWEQGKILLTSMSLWFILEYIIIGRKIKGFIFIHTIIAAALPTIMLIVYLSQSQLFGGLSTTGAHIILTIALIIAGFSASAIMATSEKDYSVYTPYGIVIYTIIVLTYMLFTYLPPNLSMFYDEVNQAYGPVFGN